MTKKLVELKKNGFKISTYSTHGKGEVREGQDGIISGKLFT